LPKIDELIEYLESTWIGESALFGDQKMRIKFCCCDNSYIDFNHSINTSKDTSSFTENNRARFLHSKK
jgi:hypothetical protein